MSLVSGFILGIAMYHLFPHSLLHFWARTPYTPRRCGWCSGWS